MCQIIFKYIIHINPFNPYNNPVRKVVLQHLHFTDEKAETEGLSNLPKVTQKLAELRFKPKKLAPESVPWYVGNRCTTYFSKSGILPGFVENTTTLRGR